MTVAIRQFKETDLQAVKVDTAGAAMLDSIQADRTALKAGALDCFVLGDVLYQMNAHPLVPVLTQEVFRVSMRAITDFFKRPGTFEFYLAVFRAVWGEDVGVVFTIPFPGKLIIDIDASTIANYDFQVREIIGGSYVFTDLHTTDDDAQITVRDATGVQSQAQVDKMMRELNPQGFVIITNLV